MYQDYFDHMASTACHPEVVETLKKHLENTQFIANPSANHARGVLCQEALLEFKKRFLQYLGQEYGRIIWTSGATEAINLALSGLAHQYRHCGNHIISTVTEHKATLETLKALENRGFSVTLVPVDKRGMVSLDVLKKAIRDNTILLSIMHVHNEIGCIQAIDSIANLCYEKGIMCHLDCAQTIGKTSMKLPKHITAASFSAHKCYGPQGVGALYLSDNPKRKLQPIIVGGGQQSHLRSGTIPLFLIAGFIKAIDLFHNHHITHAEHYATLRQAFITKLHTKIKWNSCQNTGIKQLIHISLPSVDQQALHALKQAYCISSQSACSSSSHSHVLAAIGLNETQQATALRISLAHNTTLDQAHALIKAINRLIELPPNA